MKTLFSIFAVLFIGLPATASTDPSCERAAILAASALSEVQSFAYEMDKWGAPDTITLGFPNVEMCPHLGYTQGRIETNSTLIRNLENNGKQIRYEINTYSCTGNHIEQIAVTVDSYKKVDRTFCRIKSAISLR